MPERDDETPTSPAIAEQLERINARVRGRTAQTIETARVHAIEIVVALGGDLDDPQVETVTTMLRGMIETVRRNVLRGAEEEIESLTAERDRLRDDLERVKRIRHAELARRSRER